MKEFIVLLALLSPFFLIYFMKIKKKRALEERKKQLMNRYDDEYIVDQILKKKFWQGQTAGQLIDSIGRPEDIETKVLKTKSREIWKYGQTGKGRYSLRITLENDEVVGWESK